MRTQAYQNEINKMNYPEFRYNNQQQLNRNLYFNQQFMKNYVYQ